MLGVSTIQILLYITLHAHTHTYPCTEERQKKPDAYFFKSFTAINDDVGPEVADGHRAVETLIKGSQRGITKHHVTAVVG